MTHQPSPPGSGEEGLLRDVMATRQYAQLQWGARTIHIYDTGSGRTLCGKTPARGLERISTTTTHTICRDCRKGERMRHAEQPPSALPGEGVALPDGMAERDVIPRPEGSLVMECGCGVFIADENSLQGLGDTVKHCPMHAAAGEMLAALEARQTEVDHIIACTDGCGQNDDCDEGLRLGARETELRHAALGKPCCAAARGGA